MKVREAIGWVEQERDNGTAYYCWRTKDGRVCKAEIVSFTIRPPSGGGGTEHRFPVKVAA